LLPFFTEVSRRGSTVKIEEPLLLVVTGMMGVMELDSHFT